MIDEHFQPGRFDLILDAIYAPWYTVTTFAARGLLRILGGHP